MPGTWTWNFLYKWPLNYVWARFCIAWSWKKSTFAVLSSGGPSCANIINFMVFLWCFQVCRVPAFDSLMLSLYSDWGHESRAWDSTETQRQTGQDDGGQRYIHETTGGWPQICLQGNYTPYTYVIGGKPNEIYLWNKLADSRRSVFKVATCLMVTPVTFLKRLSEIYSKK